jgi:hypothetical protein
MHISFDSSFFDFMSSREIFYSEKCNHAYKNILPWQADNKNLSLLINVSFCGFNFNNFPNKGSSIFEHPRGIPKCQEFPFAIASRANP